jgi:hypothetical protein
MEQSYLVKERTIMGSDPALQDALAGLQGASERPRCLCVPSGVAMYVAKHAQYVVKRMAGRCRAGRR